MGLEAERIEARYPTGQPIGVDLEQTSIVRRSAATIPVGLEHGAGEVLEDAVHHELDAGRLVATDRRRRPPLDELLDLLGTTMPIPPQRTDDPAGQLAARRQ